MRNEPTTESKPEQPENWLYEGLTFAKASKEYGYAEDTLRDFANRNCGRRLKTVGRNAGRRIPRKFLHEFIEAEAS